jgi:hypothetical protein
MEKETFFHRLASLLQKSRKAQRLYSSMGKTTSDVSPYSESQIEEWRTISADIVKQLSQVMDRPHTKNLISEVVAIRDNFYQLWRTSESSLHKVQHQLIAASEKGDFVRAVSLSEEAVVLKARVQAAHAAHHEFSETLKNVSGIEKYAESSQQLATKQNYNRFTHEYDSLEQLIEDRSIPEQQSRPALAKVIPLRRA